jgi:hypothetical protein
MAGATAAAVEEEARDGMAAAAAAERTRTALRKAEKSERKISTVAFHFFYCSLIRHGTNLNNLIFLENKMKPLCF